MKVNNKMRVHIFYRKLENKEKNDMRKVKQLDICYNHDNDHGKHCSAFVGVCKSRELFERY